jgi:hypothetical protein
MKKKITRQMVIKAIKEYRADYGTDLFTAKNEIFKRYKLNDKKFNELP